MNLEELNPTIVTDSREQNSLVFTRLNNRRGSLRWGDYSIHGLEYLVTIERKTVEDFTACVMGEGLEYDSVRRLEHLNEGEGKYTNRGRFERELSVMAHMDWARLIVIGASCCEDLMDYKYRSQINPLSVVNTARSIDAEFVPVCFFQTATAAALQVEEWCWWLARRYARIGKTLALRIRQAVDCGQQRSGGRK